MAGIGAPGAPPFDATVQNQRGALALVGGVLYLPFGGHAGDCGEYRGWVVGIPTADPRAGRGFATAAQGGGVWAPSGVSSDGASLFVATGNTFGAEVWSGGEALLRLAAGPSFGGAPADYFTPSNWPELDAGDVDIGGTGPVLIDLPAATPSRLLVGLGKDGNAYLVDREDLGGVGGQVATARVSSGAIINAAAAYHRPRDLPRVQGHRRAVPSGTVRGSHRAADRAGGAAVVRRGPADALGLVRRYQTPAVSGGRLFVAVEGGLRAFAPP